MFGTLTVFLIKRLFCLSLTLSVPPPLDKFNLPLALSNSLTATLCLSLKIMKNFHQNKVLNPVVMNNDCFSSMSRYPIGQSHENHFSLIKLPTYQELEWFLRPIPLVCIFPWMFLHQAQPFRSNPGPPGQQLLLTTPYLRVLHLPEKNII